jgi:glycosyltransferase involved in cell wall biosynthesis
MKKVVHLCVRESNHGSAFGGGVGGYTNYSDRIAAKEEDFKRHSIENILVAVTLPTKRKPKILFDVVKLITDVLNLLWFIITSRPDIIHIHGMYWRSTYREIAFLLLAKIFRIKVFYEARGGSFYDCINSRGLQGRLAKILANHANALSVQGSDEFSRMKKNRETRIFFMPNVINPYLEALRASNPPLNDRNFDVAFLGYVSGAKNIDLLFNVAKEMPAKSFMCIGAVEEGLLDRLHLPDNVQLVGRKSKLESFRILQKSKIFFFPSLMKSEGQPNAILEAIWAGCIPIAFDHGFISDLIGDRRLLLSKKSQDAKLIARKLCEVYENCLTGTYDAPDDIFQKTKSCSEVSRLVGIYRDISLS